jgi:hypothetical protein
LLIRLLKLLTVALCLPMVSSACVVVGNCVQDTSGNYDNNQDCTFTFVGSTNLSRAEWGLESSSDCRYDYLQVNGASKYCGASGYSKAFPTELAVTGTTSFVFKSDSSATGVGFKLCDTAADGACSS